MIVAGVAIVVIVLAVIVGLTVDAMGWRGAIATWAFALAMTVALMGGALLIEAGLKP